nr:PREDICTED: salivary glue protein Sgs-3-like [Linepithema humile]
MTEYKKKVSRLFGAVIGNYREKVTELFGEFSDSSEEEETEAANWKRLPKPGTTVQRSDADQLRKAVWLTTPPPIQLRRRVSATSASRHRRPTSKAVPPAKNPVTTPSLRREILQRAMETRATISKPPEALTAAEKRAQTTTRTPMTANTGTKGAPAGKATNTIALTGSRAAPKNTTTRTETATRRPPTTPTTTTAVAHRTNPAPPKSTATRITTVTRRPPETLATAAVPPTKDPAPPPPIRVRLDDGTVASVPYHAAYHSRKYRASTPTGRWLIRFDHAGQPRSTRRLSENN